MIILHGENTVASRDKLAELIHQAQNSQDIVSRLEAKKLSLAQLQEALGENSLFAEKKLIIVEGLHSLPTSKRKKALIEFLAKQTPIDSEFTQVILYESRKLTPTMIKKVSGGDTTKTQNLEFKLSNSLWKLLDNLSGSKSKNQTAKNLSLLHQSIEQNGDFMVFTMIVRQIRMLIQAKDNGQLKGAPFMITKLKKQANNFTLKQLLQLHSLLLKIDLQQKTSTNYLSLPQQLDLLLINM